MAESKRDAAPARAPWPPLLILGALLAGRALDWLTGGALAGLVAFPGAALLGAFLVALALANDVWCATIFARLDTTILPHRAASRLATEGPFRFSRNPIYVSHVAIVLGLGLLLSSPFTVLLTPALAFALQKLAIEPEEQHLRAKFGDAYLAYMARTRRWL
ncbi:isoprenylcysteine carboxylmethyltransferase family protein [Methylocystis echinoides]|uniref:methyltransferase family protein n=1 Tax=Methylocystis echinoides TaxID=29468 RepID=UPI00341BC3C7